jgi:DnaJ like chaperone protein
MSNSWSKWLWGGLGWAVGGPIGAILGFALGALNEQQAKGVDAYNESPMHSTPGDFGSVLLILCAALMKADNQLMKSELDYVKKFFTRQFGVEYTKERMLLLREILKQDIQLEPVCRQVSMHLNYSSRLELMHLLFGLADADKSIHESELRMLQLIAEHCGISQQDFNSIKAMFVKDKDALYKMLEVEESVSDDEIKKAYRRMAMKYHPDKIHHLGPDFQKDAQEKFRKVNEAYEEIKKQRGIK